MRRNAHAPIATARVFASRWKLKLRDRVAETKRAHVFKVDSPNGPAALKIYKEIGSSGEGAGVHFLRSLDHGVGVQIYRSSLLRPAVLMEWVEGPLLLQLVKDGQDGRATRHLGQVASAVAQTDFRFPFLFPRIVPRLKRDFARCVDQSSPATPQGALERTKALLDDLSRTSPAERVVHGDLGFNNIILTQDGPRLIDPKGLRADPSFELAQAMALPCNDVPIPDFIKRVESRGQILAEGSETTPLRLIQWSTIMMAHRVIYGGRNRPDPSPMQPYLTALLDMSGQ